MEIHREFPIPLVINRESIDKFVYMFVHIYGITYIIASMRSPENLFSILSDLTRLRILMLIGQEKDLCVCEIMYALEESQPKISRHLAFMRNSGVVSSRREGTWMHYRLNSRLPPWSQQLLAHTFTELHDLDPFERDRSRLATMVDRPGMKCA